MVGDVLDLVGDRPAVDLAQLGQDVGEALAVDTDSQHGGGDLLLELRRELRDSSGSSVGSPTGSEPSGSRRAAR